MSAETITGTGAAVEVAPTSPPPSHVSSRPAGPSMATARMADGTLLRTLHWAAGASPWAVAEIVHGLGEHGGRYGTVAAAFTDAGIDTWAYDHRGNGGSGGPRVYVDRWSILHDDLETRLRTLHEQHPDVPLVLFGHSLGGLVACGYVLSEEPRLQPDLLVLSAPGLADRQPGWQRPLARLLSGVLPKLRVANSLPSSGLSRDPGVAERADADPLCCDRSTVRWGAEAFDEQDRVRAALTGLAAMPMPTYVLHGSADPIVPVEATAILGDKANATRRVHEGLRHEQHHEPEHEAVYAEVVAWIRATASSSATGSPPATAPAPAAADAS